MCLCLYSAAAISFANIIQLKMKNLTEKDGLKVTRNHLMITAGLWNVVLSVSTLPILPNTLITCPQSLSLTTVTMLLLSSIITLSAVWMIVSAVSMTRHPTMVSMIRSSEICISLVTESIYWSHLPNNLSVIGSLMVRYIIN